MSWVIFLTERHSLLAFLLLLLFCDFQSAESFLQIALLLLKRLDIVVETSLTGLTNDEKRLLEAHSQLHPLP